MYVMFCSLRVNFKIDLSFSEMKRVYSTIVHFNDRVFQTSKTQHEEEFII